MLDVFYPDEWYVSSWSIDYEGLYAAGYRGVIFDIDNTLAVHGGPPPQKTLELLHSKAGLLYSSDTNLQ